MRGSLMLVLPEEIREEIRKPFGKVLAGKKFLQAAEGMQKPVISVGDQCSFDLIKNGTPPDMLIIDFKIKREEISAEMKKVIAPFAKNAFVVLSPPGKISGQLLDAVERLLAEGKGAIFVAGEDDLSSLLVMAQAEKGTLIYGQPDMGAVVVPLGSKEVQENAQKFLDRMKEE